MSRGVSKHPRGSCKPGHLKEFTLAMECALAIDHQILISKIAYSFEWLHQLRCGSPSAKHSPLIRTSSGRDRVACGHADCASRMHCAATSGPGIPGGPREWDENDEPMRGHASYDRPSIRDSFARTARRDDPCLFSDRLLGAGFGRSAALHPRTAAGKVSRIAH